MARWRALIVDDSPSMRRQLFHALRRMGELEAVEATDGADAWRKLAASRFDVVLTDVNMPILDGLKLVAMVRAGGVHQATPIVVITTEGAEADRNRAMSLGATAYLVKPVQAQQVIDTVRALLRAGGSAAP
jgi:two-component system chemotaxis response regulator CheY